MYKGRPVIGSAVGGIADQIVDGDTGVLLPDPTDLNDFAETLGELLGAPERLDAMGTRAHERVVDNFLPDTQLARWRQMMSTLLESTPP
jgi:trehalose synthase